MRQLLSEVYLLGAQKKTSAVYPIYLTAPGRARENSNRRSLGAPRAAHTENRARS